MSERDHDRRDESQAGIDVTLIDEMPRMSVRLRLGQNDRAAALAGRLRAMFKGGNQKEG